MDELKQALTAIGIEWSDVWRLSVDRKTGQVVVVDQDGRKMSGALAGAEPGELPPRRVKAIKRVMTADDVRRGS